MQCLGRTKTFKRCGRQAKRWFCHSHRWQPFVTCLATISTIAMFGGLYQDILRPLWFGPAVVVENEEPVPYVALTLQNTTGDDVAVLSRGDIVIWLPQGVDNLRRIPGRYDIKAPEPTANGVVLIEKGASLDVIVQVNSEVRLDTLLKREVGDLEFIFRLDPGGIRFSGGIPFQRETLVTTRYQIDLSRDSGGNTIAIDSWTKTSAILNELSVYQGMKPSETGFVSRASFLTLLQAIEYPDDEFIAARDNALATIEAAPIAKAGAAQDLQLSQEIVSSLDRLFTLAKLRVLDEQTEAESPNNRVNRSGESGGI